MKFWKVKFYWMAINFIAFKLKLPMVCVVFICLQCFGILLLLLCHCFLLILSLCIALIIVPCVLWWRVKRFIVEFVDRKREVKVGFLYLIHWYEEHNVNLTFTYTLECFKKYSSIILCCSRWVVTTSSRYWKIHQVIINKQYDIQ